MIKLPFKPLTLLAIPLALCATLNAATTTDPVGVVKITIAGTGGGSNKLTAISATLTNSTAYQGTATLNVGTFSTDSQPLETGVTTWSATEWTAEPHLCYIENTAGAEEAYLITANATDGVLTLSTTFDLNSRYTSTPNYRIVKAHTFGSLFGTDGASVPFKQSAAISQADNIYIWNGSSWVTYYHDGSNWSSTGSFGSVNDAVIFPDEGMFVLRRDTSDITITLNGSVPTKVQVSTIAGSKITFLSTRYPVDTTVANLGLTSLPNWQSSPASSSADRFYLWNGTAWDIYWHDGSSWVSTATFGNVDNTAIPADSAIFVKRVSSSTEAVSANEHDLPYAP